LNGSNQFPKKPPDWGRDRLFWFCWSQKNCAWTGMLTGTAIASTAAATSQRIHRILPTMPFANQFEGYGGN
jgi:hypothetical protein